MKIVFRKTCALNTLEINWLIEMTLSASFFVFERLFRRFQEPVTRKVDISITNEILLTWWKETHQQKHSNWTTQHASNNWELLRRAGSGNNWYQRLRWKPILDFDVCTVWLNVYLFVLFCVYRFLCTFGFTDRRKDLLVVESIISLTERKHRISRSF